MDTPTARQMWGRRHNTTHNTEAPPGLTWRGRVLTDHGSRLYVATSLRAGPLPRHCVHVVTLDSSPHFCDFASTPRNSDKHSVINRL
ncbi:Hypothetical predicted protein, partial [Pelobates cultripes]